MSTSAKTQQEQHMSNLVERYGQQLPQQMFPILLKHLDLADTIRVLEKTIIDIETKVYDPTLFTTAAVDLSRRKDYWKMTQVTESIMAIRKNERDLIGAIIKEVDKMTAPWIDMKKLRAQRVDVNYTNSDGQRESFRLPSYHDMACRLQQFEVAYLMATLYNIPQRLSIIKMLNERLRRYPYHPFDPQWTHNPMQTRYIMYVALFIRASIRDTVSLDYVENVNETVQAAMDRQSMMWAMEMRKAFE